MSGFVAKNIYCVHYLLLLYYDVCRLIERDVACSSETLLLLAYAVASLGPKSHACPETGLVGRRRLISVTKCLVLSTISISLRNIVRKWTWNEWDFRPPVCTYRLNWARITSWEWWDEWDDTALQTQDSQFEPWRSDAVHGTYGSRRLTTILFLRVDGEETFLFLSNRRDRGTNRGTNLVSAWKAAVPTATLGPPPIYIVRSITENRVIVTWHMTAQ